MCFDSVQIIIEKACDLILISILQRLSFHGSSNVALHNEWVFLTCVALVRCFFIISCFIGFPPLSLYPVPTFTWYTSAGWVYILERNATNSKESSLIFPKLGWAPRRHLMLHSFIVEAMQERNSFSPHSPALARNKIETVPFVLLLIGFDVQEQSCWDDFFKKIFLPLLYLFLILLIFLFIPYSMNRKLYNY